MIKVDIAEQIADRAEVPRVLALKSVDYILDQIKDALIKGDRVEIRGFGVFQKKLRKSSVGRDIQRSQTISIPETYTVKFKPGVEMREIQD